MSVSPQALRGQQQQRSQPIPPAFSIREFSGMNLADSRLSIGDNELAFLENGMILGSHVVPVPLYNGAAGNSLNGTSIVKESYGTSLTYTPAATLAFPSPVPFTEPHPVAIVVFEDGSAWMRDLFNDNPVDISIGVAGTFGASPKGTAIKIWQDGPVLFQDELAGYLSWNGAALVTLDTSKTGGVMVVFEGHVFLKTAPRTFTFTAPSSYTDFATGDGAGSFKITDDAFPGAIQAAFSTVEQMWILGASAIDALGNVATSGGVTTFSVTNALTSLGCTFRDSVIGFFRALTFSTGYSIHSLLGVTPQKLSGKIDPLFLQLDNLITFGPRVGVQQINGITVLVFLFQFTDGQTGASRSMLICFQEGKWFLARTPDLNGFQVVDLVTLTIHGFPEVYGIDRAGRMYRVFARVGTQAITPDPQQGTMTVSTKLYDFGEPTKGHQGIKVGVDLSGPLRTSIVPITLTYVTERGVAQTETLYENFQRIGDAPMGRRYAFLRRNLPENSQRIGLTIQIPCSYGVGIDAIHFEHRGTDDFDVVDPQVQVVNFTNNLGQIVRFTNAQNAVAADWLASLTG